MLGQRKRTASAALRVFGGENRIRTGGEGFAGLCLTTWPSRHVTNRAGVYVLAGPDVHGADNGVRTRDPHLGKVVLYQLSHVRVQVHILRKPRLRCKNFFLKSQISIVQVKSSC